VNNAIWFKLTRLCGIPERSRPNALESPDRVDRPYGSERHRNNLEELQHNGTTRGRLHIMFLADEQDDGDKDKDECGHKESNPVSVVTCQEGGGDSTA